MVSEEPPVVHIAPEPPPEEWEVISPELVLVADPESARRALAQLPEPMSWRLSAAARMRAAADAPPPQLQTAPRRSRRPLRYALAAVALAVLGYGVAAFTLNETASDVAAPATHQPSSAVAGTSGLPKTQTQPVVPAVAGEVVPTGVPPTRPVGSTSAAASTTPPAATGFIPARTWTWTAVPGVKAYVVTFLRNGRAVFTDRVRQASLQLPASFRFVPGTYRWTVTTAGNGTTVVESSFVLNAAQAAAANASTP